MENKNNISFQEVKEKNKRIIKIALAILLVIIAFLSGVFASNFRGLVNSKDEDNTGRINSSQLKEIINILEDKWFYADNVENLESVILQEGLSGLTNSQNDPYTYYLTAQEYQEQVNNTNQNYVGLGVQISLLGEYPLITNVFKGSPAETYGLRAGDYIIKVDGTDVKDMENDPLTDLVLGEEGSEVVVTYLRGDVSDVVTIIRAQITHTVDYQVKDGIGYLEVSSFGNSTANEVVSALDEFESQGISDLIIDLRDNGGGYLQALIDFASLFLPKGETIIQMKYRDGSIEPYYAEGKNRDFFQDIIVLVNENSASASEVFAAALQENKRATIVGVQTYGKGTSQTVSYLSDGSVMQYTQTNWLTPKGNLLQDIGVTPDIEVKLDDYLYIAYQEVPENLAISFDAVSEWVALVQSGLDMMGYDVDRNDGYFSAQTEAMIKQYASDYQIDYSGVLTPDFIHDFISNASFYYYNNIEALDYQMSKALALLK
ncbi:MAG: S41 family peptidase [Erysipelotrichaceae bacterium]